LIFSVRRWKSVSRWLILTSALGSFDPKADFISKLGGALAKCFDFNALRRRSFESCSDDIYQNG
jgi:hypothetical protein